MSIKKAHGCQTHQQLSTILNLHLDLECRDRPQPESESRSLVSIRNSLRNCPLAYLEAQMVKTCLQCRRLRFYPWVGKIPLEKGMATHSSILAWEIPWTEKPGRLHPRG